MIVELEMTPEERALYASPFFKFALPDEAGLLDSWLTHFVDLDIRVWVVGTPKKKELLVNIQDHERELGRKL